VQDPAAPPAPHVVHMVKAAGVSDDIAMDLGRWRDVTTTRRYGGAQAIERAHRELSPRERI
jgi:hypothetical protein